MVDAICFASLKAIDCPSTNTESAIFLHPLFPVIKFSNLHIWILKGEETFSVLTNEVSAVVACAAVHNLHNYNYGLFGRLFYQIKMLIRILVGMSFKRDEACI